MKKNRGAVYVALSVMTLSLGGDAVFFAAKQNMAHAKMKLEDENARLAQFNKALAAERTRLNERSTSLETELAGVRRDADGLRAELESERAQNLKAQSDIAAKGAQIVALKDEVDRMAACNKDIEQRLGSLTAAYDYLNERFSDVSARKKRSERKLNGFISRFFKEESVTSLGTVVISK